MSEKEGAIVQLAVAPTDNRWQKNGSEFVQNIEKNNSDPDKEKINVPQEKIQAINKKISKPGLISEIRVVTSAPTRKSHKDASR